MCLIAFALNAEPRCPLLIAANRDEFHDRPTAALHRWTLDDGTESVFGPGTVLQVTGTDGKSFVDVITSDGVTGRIAIEQPAGDWQWYIDGESELEYFELVPYVG